jgi:hypothetical protein
MRIEMDVQEEFVELLANELDKELHEWAYMLKRGYTCRVETWIERGFSPFPNQDRRWRITWTKEN